MRAVAAIAAVLTVCTSCYLGPIRVYSTNTPPELLNAHAPTESDFVLETEQKLFVVVSDEEPDLVHFTWTMSREGILPNVELITGDNPGSQVVLQPDPSYDGQVVTCIADDGEYVESWWWTLVVE